MADNTSFANVVAASKCADTPKPLSLLRPVGDAVEILEGILEEGEIVEFVPAEFCTWIMRTEDAGKAPATKEAFVEVDGEAVQPGIEYRANTNPQRAYIPTRWRVKSHYGIEASVSSPDEHLSSSGPSTPIEDLGTTQPQIVALPRSVPALGAATPSRKKRRIPAYTSPHRVSRAEIDELYPCSQLAFDGKGWPYRPEPENNLSPREHFETHQDVVGLKNEYSDDDSKSPKKLHMPPHVLVNRNGANKVGGPLKRSRGAPVSSREPKFKTIPRHRSDSSKPSNSPILGKRKQLDSPNEDNKLRRSSRFQHWI